MQGQCGMNPFEILRKKKEDDEDDDDDDDDKNIEIYTFTYTSTEEQEEKREEKEKKQEKKIQSDLFIQVGEKNQLDATIYRETALQSKGKVLNAAHFIHFSLFLCHFCL